MKHARADYDRIQDPINKIPADEPVMLFRAQDQYATQALLGYVRAIHSDSQATAEALAVADVVQAFIIEFVGWQAKKSPDLPQETADGS